MTRRNHWFVILCKLGEDNQCVFYNNIYIIYDIKNQKKIKNFVLLKKTGDKGDRGDTAVQTLAIRGMSFKKRHHFVTPVTLFLAKICTANKLVQRKISELNFIPP